VTYGLLVIRFGRRFPAVRRQHYAPAKAPIRVACLAVTSARSLPRSSAGCLGRVAGSRNAGRDGTRNSRSTSSRPKLSRLAWESVQFNGAARMPAAHITGRASCSVPSFSVTPDSVPAQRTPAPSLASTPAQRRAILRTIAREPAPVGAIALPRSTMTTRGLGILAKERAQAARGISVAASMPVKPPPATTTCIARPRLPADSARPCSMSVRGDRVRQLVDTERVRGKAPECPGGTGQGCR